MAADGGYASGGNLKAAKEKGVRDMAFHKKRGLKIEDMVRSRWVYRKLRKLPRRHRGRHLVPEAGLWLGALHLEGPGPLQGPTSGPRWCGLQPGALRTPQAGISPAHNRARYKTGRRPALDHVRILPRTPTATTTYYHVGKIPSLDIKNCTNPAPAACGQPKTPAKHPVYGRTLASEGDRFAAGATFAVTASGITAFGIGAAFWGLVAGLALVGLDHARARWRAGP